MIALEISRRQCGMNIEYNVNLQLYLVLLNIIRLPCIAYLISYLSPVSPTSYHILTLYSLTRIIPLPCIAYFISYL